MALVMATERLPQYRIDEYSIGWVCPLEKEARAAQAILDELHEPLYIEADPNSYTFGRVGHHNIVIATLPAGVYGNVSAAAVVVSMRRSLPMLKGILLVGIGAGIPSYEHDIRLGDVVVSRPNHHDGGVVQFDFGTEHADGSFTRKGLMNKPSDVLLSALNTFQVELGNEDTQLAELMRRASRKRSVGHDIYTYPGTEYDHLFPPDYSCVSRDQRSCNFCDKSQMDTRRQDARRAPYPHVHCGTIATGNKLVRNPALRDKLWDEYRAMCIEMEAAGVMSLFQGLVIRGICDYADSHKNDIWHDYAALAAAACAKLLLSHVSPMTLLRATRIGASNTGYDEYPVAYGTRDKPVHIVVKDDYVRRNFRGLDIYVASKRHQFHLAKTLDGTWQAVLQDPVFIEWKSPKSESSVLCCFGNPGVGKSCLMSRIIKKLEHDQVGSDVRIAIAYLFCSYNDSAEIVASRFASIAVQLISQASISSDELEQLFDGRKTHEEMISSLVDKFDIMYFCLDGLDEVKGEQRTRLLSALQQAGKASRILLTARTHLRSNLLRQFRTARELTVTGSQADIEAHIGHRVISSDNGWVEVQDDIKRRIVDISKGNFLFADKLISIALLNDTVAGICRAMTQFPQTLDAVYADMLERVRLSDHFDQARRILIWVSFCERPLNLSELRLALAVEEQQQVDPEKDSPDKGGLLVDEENLISQSTLEAICQGLVQVDESDQAARVFHLSFQEYLRAPHLPTDDVRNHFIQGAHERIAQSCLVYLNLPDILEFSRRRAESRQSCGRDDLHGVFALLDYASSFWGSHVRKAGQTELTLSMAMSYIRKSPMRRYAMQWFLSWNMSQRYRAPDIMSFVLSFSRLHLAAYFGLDRIIRTLVDDFGVDVNVPDCCGAMPLHWAAGYGNKDAVKLLLARNADVLARDGISSGGGTALTRAIDWEAVATEWTRADDQNAVRESAQQDAIEITRLLLKSGAMVNFVYHVPECRFSVVSAPGRDVDLDKKNGYMSHVFVFQSYTPLMRASQLGNIRLVQQLLLEGADLNGRGSHGWNALHYAILEQREDVVQLLLDRGIDTGIEDHELDEKPGGSSVYLMQKRKETIMQTISSVVAGRMNRLADLFDASPLLYMDKASPFPHELDRNDPFTNVLTFKFKPVDPLIATTRLREAAWVRLMLKDIQTIHQGRDDDRTALSWAAELGEVKIMDALLRSEAQLSIAERDRGGRDALSWAAQGGHLEAVKFLIRKGLSTGSSDRCGYTPLMWGVMCQKIATVRYLLDKKKADIHANDNSGQSALTWAAGVGIPELISFLLERHAVLDHEDRMGRTPLTWAAACGKCDAVRELLRHGANESHRDRNGHTPLFWAIKGGHLSIIRIFHDRGQSLDDRDNEGRTPLHWAAGRGHGEAVEYLVSHGVDMNSHDHSRVSALSWATSGGHDRVTEALLKAGANPNSVDNEGSTPILCAARGASALTLRGRKMYTDAASLNPLLPVNLSVSGDIEGFREAMALPYDFHPNWVLEYEYIHRAPKVVVTLLKHGADIESRDKDGRTALSIVAEQGNAALAKALLNMGASPDSLDNEGRTPISWAAGCQHGQSILRLLLQKSRQVTAFDHKDNTGRSPLSWAAGSGNLHSVQLLLLKGADVCSVDHTGRIPLSWAIQRGSRELVTRLMVNETNIPYKDTIGRTLLSYAAEGGDADTFDTILSQQPDAIDVPDKSGRTPLCWISGGDPGSPALCVIDEGAVPTQQDLVFCFQRGPPKGNGRVTLSLLSQGANLEHRDSNRMTPLMWAAANGHPVVVERLLEKKADKEATDIHGRTPLLHAIANGHGECMEILVNAGANTDHLDCTGISALTGALMQSRSSLGASAIFIWHSKGRKLEICASGTRDALGGRCRGCKRHSLASYQYFCIGCALRADIYVICQSCFEAGKQCPEMHTLIQCRLTLPELRENGVCSCGESLQTTRHIKLRQKQLRALCEVFAECGDDKEPLSRFIAHLEKQALLET